MKKINIFIALTTILYISFTPISLAVHNETHHTHTECYHTTEHHINEEATHDCSVCHELVHKNQTDFYEFDTVKEVVNYQNIEKKNDKTQYKQHKSLIVLNVKHTE